jgi:hypothetical protein
MLLNEFLKARRRIEEQDKRIDQLTAQLKEQAAQIQKVRPWILKGAHFGLLMRIAATGSVTLCIRIKD